MQSLDRALVHQKFWRYVGWLTAITLVLYLIIFVVVITAGVFGAAGR